MPWWSWLLTGLGLGLTLMFISAIIFFISIFSRGFWY